MGMIHVNHESSGMVRGEECADHRSDANSMQAFASGVPGQIREHLCWLTTDPRLDSIRSEPRYKDLIRRLHLTP